MEFRKGDIVVVTEDGVIYDHTFELNKVYIVAQERGIHPGMPNAVCLKGPGLHTEAIYGDMPRNGEGYRWINISYLQHAGDCYRCISMCKRTEKCELFTPKIEEK